MSDTQSRSLEASEITKLLTQERIGQPAPKWPNAVDLKTLAHAVQTRDHYVTLSSGVRFIIRYESRYQAVFVRPDNGEFAPCGYISYKKLSEALLTSTEAVVEE